MRNSMFAMLAATAMLLLAGCGGDGDGDVDQDQVDEAVQKFFSPENADAYAHATMPDISELPGAGWEVAARDEFDDEDDETDDEFDEALANEPACAELNALDSLGSVFGESGDDDELPAGRAQIEFARSSADNTLPTSVEISVEIERTVAEVEGSWGLVAGIFEDGQTQTCLLNAMRVAFADLAAESGGEINISSRELSASAPHDAVGMAFDIEMSIIGVELEMAIEMYMWPYGNAGVSVVFSGVNDTIDADLIDPVLALVDEKVVATGKFAAQSATPTP